MYIKRNWLDVQCRKKLRSIFQPLLSGPSPRVYRIYPKSSKLCVIVEYTMIYGVYAWVYFLFSWLVWLYQCYWSNPEWYGSDISLPNFDKVRTIYKCRRIYCKRNCRKVCLFGWKGLGFPAITYKWLRCRRYEITLCSNSFWLPLSKRTLDSSWYHQWSPIENK